MVCWPEYGVTSVGCFKSYGWLLAAMSLWVLTIATVGATGHFW